MNALVFLLAAWGAGDIILSSARLVREAMRKEVAPEPDEATAETAPKHPEKVFRCPDCRQTFRMTVGPFGLPVTDEDISAFRARHRQWHAENHARSRANGTLS